MNVLKKSAKNGEDNGMPRLPTGPTQVRKSEIWVLWTFSGCPIYSCLTLEGRVMH